MNWYKQSQAFEAKTLDDRNVINEKISFFEELDQMLEKMAKVVFQDGYHVKELTYKIANDKKMSSHPTLRDKLLEADRVALDSPWKFSQICLDCSDDIKIKISKLKNERKVLTEEGMPSRMRGWVDKHGR